MKQFLACFLTFGFLLTFETPTLAHDRRKKADMAMPGINVSVYNYAQAPQQTLDRTEREVAGILHEAGVEATWRNCNPALADTHQDTNCTQVASPTNLILRILPEIPVTTGVTNDHTMGFAFGNYATVSFRWSREEAAAVGSMPSEILTIAATHELGHLLLGEGSHTPRGVMRARFSREDFSRAPLGAFTFTTAQGEQMLAEVRERENRQGAWTPTIRIEASTRERMEEASLAAMSVEGAGTVVLATGPVDAQNGPMAMTLRVRDYSHLDRSNLLGAEQEATGILAQAGVNARWTDCPTLPGDLANFPNCQPPWQVNDYVINVMPDSMAVLLGKSDDALGLATDCGMGPSCTASVFYDRVSKLAGGDRAPAEVLLGRAMAHEIGHLLLGANSHSPTGIMRGHWSPREFRLDARLDLLFTAGQSRRMKTRLAEREQLSLAKAKVAEIGQ